MARQDPWDNVPVVRMREQEAPAPASRATVNGRRYETVRSSFTNETPEQLAAQGYTLDPETGSYARTVGTIPAPWESVPVANLAEDQAVQALGSSGALNVPGAYTPFMRSALEQAPFGDEIVAGIASLGSGQSYGDIRRTQRQIADYDRQNYSTDRNLGGVAGFAAGLAAPGGAYIRGARGLQQVGRAAAVGGAYGGAYGSGAAEDDYASRLSGLGGGALIGALGGAGVQRGAQAVAGSGIGQRLAGIAGIGTRPDPEVVAARRLARTIPDREAAIAERARLQSLGLDPSLMDVTGGTTERAIRAAAGPAGPGAEAAVGNMVARQANLKPEVMGLTRGLSDDPRSALAVREGLEEARDALATTQYAEPYAAQVPLTPEAVRAIRGGGQSAIREAIEDELASPNFDARVVEELQSLLTTDLDQIPSVSGRALDRVRIALRDTSDGLMRGDRPNRTRARGFAERVSGVDTALDNAPGLLEARGTFRNLSGAVEAIDNASQVFNTDPRDFAQIVRELTPEQRQAMVIGVRQEIMDNLGGQRAAGTGSLQTLSEAPYARQNLEALLGAEEAANYIGSIRARVEQAQRAARVSPSTNSQTFGRAQDEAAVNAVEVVSAALDGFQTAGGNALAGARTANRLSNFVAARTMTPEVRAAIVDLGIGSADELERVLELGSTARAANRPPPREVRAYLAKVQGQLGAQNPVTARLEQLLLPSRVSAEEEAQ